MPLQELFLDLVKAELHFKPAHICLTSQNTQSRLSNTIRILVPRGREAEAVQLVERFRTETMAAKNTAHYSAEPA